jgi:ketosteroid isomerase-like protein
MFSEVHAEVTEIRDLGDRVVGLGEIRARGRESGVEVATQVGWFLEVRDGMMRRGWAFTSHAEALKAAELSD